MADAGFDSKYADESGPSGFEGKFEGKCGGAGDSSSDDDSDDDEWEALKGKKQTGEIVTSTDPVARKILDGFRMYVLGFSRDCETYRAPSPRRALRLRLAPTSDALHVGTSFDTA